MPRIKATSSVWALKPCKQPEGTSARGKAESRGVTRSLGNRCDGAGEPKHRVFLVDDHPIVRERLAELINQNPKLEVCGEADDAPTALKAIAVLRPDIAIVDITLKDTYGIELIKSLRERHTQLPILVLSMHEESVYGERALRAGAMGYLNKQEATKKVVDALRAILAGEIYVSEKLKSDLMHRIAGLHPGKSPTDMLSDRELEVFQLLGGGLSVRQIAGALFVSVKTIEAHRDHIRKKMGFQSSLTLLRYAIDFELRARGSPSAEH